jgi:DNA-binding beta-propeller fold protein YncE
VLDHGAVTSVTVAANGPDFVRPFDSTPDPTGTNVYFTAIDADGNSGVFKAAATGGAVTKLFSGDPLVAPLGIAITSDGAQLFIADPAASTAGDRGQIYVVPVAGGTPTPFGGTDGYVPKSVTVVGTTLYFAGIDKTSGAPGVFKVPVSGGNVDTVATGVLDPSGVAADRAGNVYFVDTIGGAHSVIYKVAPGSTTPTPIVTELIVGYPAGIALSGDGAVLLASSIAAATRTDEVRVIDLASNQSTSNASGEIGSNIEAAGLHRAANAAVYSWADSMAHGTGTIYVLK